MTTWVNARNPASIEAIGAVLSKIRPLPAPGETSRVEFAFNPERVTVSHTYNSYGVTGKTAEEQIRNLGYVEIGIDKVLLVGEKTKQLGNALLSWSRMYTPPPTIGSPGAGQPKPRAIGLMFRWGTEGLRYEVGLRSVTVTYQRFAWDGTPIRAECRLSLYAGLDKILPATNPTSGGPAGRSTRVLNSSECLASVAAASYGRPGTWRRIARANGVDDPLRVRPGTQLYLPEPGDER